ncbi:AAA domain containing protein [Candidatus Nanopelagicaceae bacterium]
MSHVMRSDRIPSDAGIAIEYRLNGRRFRLDFVISGVDSRGKESLVIVELKQWTDIQFSDLDEHVKTVLGGGVRDVTHPSYQVWSYKSHLEMFNEYVYENELSVEACAYLHNCKDNQVINNSRYENALRLAPVFFHGEHDKLQKLIEGKIEKGSGTSLLERVDAAVIRPSKQLADAVGNMLQGQDEFILLDEQKTAYETILRSARQVQESGKKVIIIKGGPGTGKSVISINALAKLTSERMNVKYVTANAAPRDVFQAKLKNLVKGDSVKHLFGGSGSYTESKKDSMDVLIVDEAHRLRMKSGMFKNLGESQAKEIINSAKLSVFFIDEAQKVTWSDVGEISRIKAYAAILGADVELLELISQFRCGGSDDYMAWLDDSLGLQDVPENYFSREKFDFQIFDSASKLHDAIRKKNQVNNKSRIVAGYCWNWVSKKDPKAYDIVIPEENYQARWNLASYGNEWIINPKSVDEVGCIHTCQGLEVDYVGVIVGNDLGVESGKLVTSPRGRAKSDKSLNGYVGERKLNPEAADAKADELIRNTYRTLMSRGMKGCYVYFTDPEVKKYFKSWMPK